MISAIWGGIPQTSPIFIGVPTVIAGVLTGGSENWILLMLVVLSFIYILESSRITRNDYMQAISNHQIADERAQLMELLSITDLLTDLKNRLYFNRRIIEEWKGCDRL